MAERYLIEWEQHFTASGLDGIRRQFKSELEGIARDADRIINQGGSRQAAGSYASQEVAQLQRDFETRLRAAERAGDVTQGRSSEGSSLRRFVTEQISGPNAAAIFREIEVQSAAAVRRGIEKEMRAAATAGRGGGAPPIPPYPPSSAGKAQPGPDDRSNTSSTATNAQAAARKTIETIEKRARDLEALDTGRFARAQADNVRAGYQLHAAVLGELNTTNEYSQAKARSVRYQSMLNASTQQLLARDGDYARARAQATRYTSIQQAAQQQLLAQDGTYARAQAVITRSKAVQQAAQQQLLAQDDSYARATAVATRARAEQQAKIQQHLVDDDRYTTAQASVTRAKTQQQAKIQGHLALDDGYRDAQVAVTQAKATQRARLQEGLAGDGHYATAQARATRAKAEITAREQAILADGNEYAGALARATRSKAEISAKEQAALAIDDKYIQATAAAAVSRDVVARKQAEAAADPAAVGVRTQRRLAEQSLRAQRDIDYSGAVLKDPILQSQLVARTALNEAVKRQQDIALEQLRMDERVLGETAQLARLKEQRNARESAARLGVVEEPGETTAQLEGRVAARQAAREAERHTAQLHAMTANDRAILEEMAKERALERDVNRALEQRVREIRKEATPGGRGILDSPGSSWFQRIQASIQTRQTGDVVDPQSLMNFGQFIQSRAITTAGFAASGALLYGGVQAIREMVKESEQLQRIFNQIQAQFRSVGDATEFRGFRQAMFDISRETGVAASEVATVGFQMKGAFGDTAEAVKETSDAIKVAVVTGLPQKELTDSLTAAAKAYGVSIADIGDEAIGLEERFGVLSAESLKVFGDMASVADEAGLSLKELGAIVGTIQQASGRPGSSIAEALGRVLPAVQQQGLAVLQEYNQNPALSGGVGEIQDALSRGETGRVLVQLMKDWGGLDQATKNYFLTLLGGRRESATLIPLFNNIDKALTEMDRRETDAGKTSQRFRDIQGTLAQAVARFRAELVNLGNDLAQAGLLDALRDIAVVGGGAIRVLDLLVGLFSSLSEHTGGIPGRIAAIALAIVGLNRAMALFRNVGQLGLVQSVLYGPGGRGGGGGGIGGGGIIVPGGGGGGGLPGGGAVAAEAVSMGLFARLGRRGAGFLERMGGPDAVPGPSFLGMEAAVTPAAEAAAATAAAVAAERVAGTAVRTTESGLLIASGTRPATPRARQMGVQAGVRAAGAAAADAAATLRTAATRPGFTPPVFSEVTLDEPGLGEALTREEMLLHKQRLQQDALGLPAPAPGLTRLFRGEGPRGEGWGPRIGAESASQGGWYTSNLDMATGYATQASPLTGGPQMMRGQLRYIDVTEEEAARFAQFGGPLGGRRQEYVVDEATRTRSGVVGAPPTMAPPPLHVWQERQRIAGQAAERARQFEEQERQAEIVRQEQEAERAAEREARAAERSARPRRPPPLPPRPPIPPVGGGVGGVGGGGPEEPPIPAVEGVGRFRQFGGAVVGAISGVAGMAALAGSSLLLEKALAMRGEVQKDQATQVEGIQRTLSTKSLTELERLKGTGVFGMSLREKAGAWIEGQTTGDTLVNREINKQTLRQVEQARKNGVLSAFSDADFEALKQAKGGGEEGKRARRLLAQLPLEQRNRLETAVGVQQKKDDLTEDILKNGGQKLAKTTQDLAAQFQAGEIGSEEYLRGLQEQLDLVKSIDTGPETHAKFLEIQRQINTEYTQRTVQGLQSLQKLQQQAGLDASAIIPFARSVLNASRDAQLKLNAVAPVIRALPPGITEPPARVVRPGENILPAVPDLADEVRRSIAGGLPTPENVRREVLGSLADLHPVPVPPPTAVPDLEAEVRRNIEAGLPTPENVQREIFAGVDLPGPLPPIQPRPVFPDTSVSPGQLRMYENANPAPARILNPEEAFGAANILVDAQRQGWADAIARAPTAGAAQELLKNPPKLDAATTDAIKKYYKDKYNLDVDPTIGATFEQITQARQRALSETMGSLTLATAGNRDPGAQAATARKLADAQLASARNPGVDSQGNPIPVNKGEVDAALAAQKEADAQALDVQRQIADSKSDLLAAQRPDDILAQARASQQKAATAAKYAQGDAAKNAAEAQRLQADRQMEDALNAITDSRITLLQTHMTIAGDEIGAAQKGVELAQNALDRARGRNASEDVINNLQGQVEQSKDQVRETTLRNREEIINFNLEMKRITVGQAISQLEALMSIANPREQRELMLRIKQLRDQAGQDLQFNIPDEIKLPTIYEVRRSLQTPEGQGYNDHRQVSVVMHVNNGMDQASATKWLTDTVGTSPRVVSRGRRIP